MDVIITDDTGEITQRFCGVAKSKLKRIAAIIGEKPAGKKAVKFVPPTIEQVRAYCEERGNHVDPERFVDHYTASGWKRSRGVSLTDWKAAVRNWEKNGFPGSATVRKSETSSIDTEKMKAAAYAKYKKGASGNEA